MLPSTWSLYILKDPELISSEYENLVYLNEICVIYLINELYSCTPNLVIFIQFPKFIFCKLQYE